MSRSRACLLILIGCAIQLAVFALPLTPYPLVHMLFARDAFDVERGFEQYLATGIWTTGDPGFELMRANYMKDVADGVRPGFMPTDLVGLTIGAFELDEPITGDPGAYDQKAYVVFSNRQAHVIPLHKLKSMHVEFHHPYAATVNVLLLVAGSWAIYRGLSSLGNKSGQDSSVYSTIREPSGALSNSPGS
jgi:hypothetical protein